MINRYPIVCRAEGIIQLPINRAGRDECEREFYDMRGIPFVQRESFNNAVLLMSMVTSEHYYIVAFSRPEWRIDLAFDFESDLHSPVTQHLSIHFGSSPDEYLLEGNVENISAGMSLDYSGQGQMIPSPQGVRYEYRFQKDEIIPLSIRKLHEIIIMVKKDIIEYVERQYQICLSV